MTNFSIVGGTVLVGAALEPGAVQVDRGLIATAGRLDNPDEFRSGWRLDATDLIVAPGLIDMQINGGFGVDLVTDPHRLWELGRRLPEYGVTAFLPTIITSPGPVGPALLDALSSRPDDYLGAEPIGAHFEGPMISQEHLGAHPLEHARPIEPDLIANWSRCGLALVTLAPELPGALDVIKTLVEAGVIVSLGHSGASADQALAGVDAGATVVTHLFNAMAPLHHRQPNLVGVALAASELTATVIADGHHVDPLVVSLAMQAKGPSHVALVSDAVAAMGLAPGDHQLGGAPVTFDGQTVRTANGTLAGAAIGLDACTRNLMAYTGCSAAEALGCASVVPAQVLGIEDRGTLAPGRIADITLFNLDLQPQVTICGGELGFVADEARCRLDEVGEAAWK